jgi:hypothetical protein
MKTYPLMSPVSPLLLLTAVQNMNYPMPQADENACSTSNQPQ